MQFETQRLLVRPWHMNTDARHAMDIYDDDRVMAWVDDDGRDTSIRQVQGRIQRYQKLTVCGQASSWAVEQKDIGRAIGHVALMPLPDIKAVQTLQLSSCVSEIVNQKEWDGMSTDYVEIGWQFRPSSWGFGYAFEATSQIVRYAFETLGLPVLLAITSPDNRRSIALIERLGMQCDGLTARCYRGQALMLYRLFSTDYEAVRDRGIESKGIEHKDIGPQSMDKDMDKSRDKDAQMARQI